MKKGGINTPGPRRSPKGELTEVLEELNSSEFPVSPFEGAITEGDVKTKKQKLLISISFIALIFIQLISCNSSKSHLRIAIAANLIPPMEAIEEAYEKKTGLHIDISAASSGALNAQLRNGAPFDIYLAANEQYPQQLFREGIGEEAPLIFTFGQLMLWSSQEIHPDSLTSALSALKSRRLAIPDPELAPYGAVAKSWLQTNSIWEQLSAKLIIGNNISHTNQIIRSGSVDFAFTAASARYWGALGAQGYWYDIPDVKPIPHALLIISQKEEVKRFVEFLKSEEAADIFEAYGYLRTSDQGSLPHVF